MHLPMIIGSRLRGLTRPRQFDLALALLIGAALFVRVLTDDRSAPGSRHSGSLNLSGVIALLFICVAGYVVLHRRHGLLPAVLATLWLCTWTVIAMSIRGASTETLHEGIREISVVALTVIAYNVRGPRGVSTVVRLIQLVGIAPAIIALDQLATHTGMNVAGHIRSNGTFAHPNSAAMFFALAGVASLWRHLNYRRNYLDMALAVLFAAALIATFSIDGLITLIVMLLSLSALHDGATITRLVPCALAGLVVVAFFATPLGSQRIAKETATNLTGAERGEPNTTLAWRLHKWKTLLKAWERRPVLGQGLGTTTTEASVAGSEFAGALPHNEYLRFLVETGVLGIAILLWALIQLARSLIRMRGDPTDASEGLSRTATLALVILVGCLVNSLADNTLLNSPTCYAAALVFGAVLSLPDIERRASPVPRTT